MKGKQTGLQTSGFTGNTGTSALKELMGERSGRIW